jgi:tRNA modification GTPase
MEKDTIYALTTPYAKSGVAIIRISGPRSMDALRSLGYKNTPQPKPRQAILHKFQDPVTNEAIDHGLFVYFPAPHSFTGEDTIELNLHGSIAVINSMLAALQGQEFLRLAEPGEFAKTAFLNCKMDLTQAEGLADLINAETRLQQKVALENMSGALGQIYEGWRKRIISLSSKIEAFIDFSDQDLPDGALDGIASAVQRLGQEIRAHLKTAKQGQDLMNGIKVGILGQPNVGKSSLINALAGDDLAIVSDIAGTTRDVIRTKLDILGFPVMFFDTAGMRDTEDALEQAGVRRSKAVMQDASIILMVVDHIEMIKSMYNAYKDILKAKHLIWVLNKSDINKYIIDENFIIEYPYIKCYSIVCAKSSEVRDLRLKLEDVIKEHYGDVSSTHVITKLRYSKALEEACLWLDEFGLGGKGLELAAEDLRFAAREIGKVTGKIDIEEVLDELFGSFCIGK